MNQEFSIIKLKALMQYYPPWHKDKEVFCQLFYKSKFNDSDILQLGRLYVKYTNIPYLYENELMKYFSIMLKKMQMRHINDLIDQTHYIYNKKSRY